MVVEDEFEDVLSGQAVDALSIILDSQEPWDDRLTVGTQLCQDGLDLLGPVGAFEGEGIKGVEEKAVVAIEGVEGVNQGVALVFMPGGHFDDQQRGDDSVFVAGVGADEITEALFIADDKLLVTCLFVMIDPVVDVLETGQGVFDREAAAAADGRTQLVGDDGLDQHRVGSNRAMARDEIDQQGADLVASQQDEIALMAHGDTDAVAVGVGAEDKIGPLGPGLLDAAGQGIAFLRIG